MSTKLLVGDKNDIVDRFIKDILGPRAKALLEKSKKITLEAYTAISPPEALEAWKKIPEPIRDIMEMKVGKITSLPTLVQGSRVDNILDRHDGIYEIELDTPFEGFVCSYGGDAMPDGLDSDDLKKFNRPLAKRIEQLEKEFDKLDDDYNKLFERATEALRPYRTFEAARDALPELAPYLEEPSDQPGPEASALASLIASARG